MKLSTRFKKLTLWNKIAVIGGICSILGLALGIAFWLFPQQTRNDTEDQSNNVSRTTVADSTLVQQSMSNSPGALQVAGDYNANNYQPISEELRSKVMQNLASLDQL